MVEETRQLVALMLTDMVGYTKTSQQDEAKALRWLDEHDRVIRGSVEGHGGRIIKGTGDGFLVEFPSALQAVTCAVDIQRVFHDRNTRSEPSDRFFVRIGLHVGDVVRRGDDIFGDGVNIVSRIEPLAAPNGICVSQTVQMQVWNKAGHRLESMGKPRLKNLELPIEVFRIALPWEDLSKEADARPAAERSRIAVLPLASISQDPEDAYFADGMTEELIYALSKIPGLKVIAQTSSMVYRGTQKTIREIGEELRVGAVLEGSVRTSGERLRIMVQLIDAASEEHLWGGRYDRELADVFEVQTEIAQNVARELKLLLRERGVEAQPTENLDAYKEYLKGRHFFARRTRTGLYTAIGHFEAAIAVDPGFAKAYSGLADSYTVLVNHGHEPADALFPKAREAARRAIELDPDLAEAHASIGIIALEFEDEPDAAERALREAIARNPSYATAWHWLALALNFVGRLDEAHEAMERALELDPMAHVVHVSYGEMLVDAGKAERAREYFRRGLELEPDYPGVSAGLARAEIALWNWRGAEDALELALRRNPNNIHALLGKAHLALLLGRPDDAVALLQRAERVEPESPMVWYARGEVTRLVGDPAKAITSFERVQTARFGISPWPALMIALCEIQLGRPARAKANLALLADHPAWRSSWQYRIVDGMLRGVLAAAEGDVTEAERFLAEVRSETISPRRHSSAAVILFTAGRLDEAFLELEQAVAAQDPRLSEFAIEPLLEPYRGDPRFQRILDVMGLARTVRSV
jgi:adenylate cyclase